MSLPLLPTKLLPPQPRADFISRPRLVHRIANPKRGRITLITAPAGYGKTTLLAVWCVAQQERNAVQKNRVAWFSLDAADNDPALFWQSVAAALRVRVNFSDTSRVNVLLAALLRTREPITLILDDLHLIHSKTILQDLARFIEHAPSHVQIILASRSEPALPLARWRARGQLNELNAHHLAFTLNEARAFLQTTMGLEISDDMVNRLKKMTEGWAAGLQLFALALQNDETTLPFPQASIFDYLAAEVLSRQPKTLQIFLLQTSLLEQFNAELANAVTLRADSAQLIARLTRANLFITALDAEREWYRYHPLFAEFLQKCSPATKLDVRVLHQRAAQWFAQNDLLPQAIDHALRANDFENAAGWIDRASETAMRRGQLETIKNWLEALPQTMVAQSHSLNLWCAWVLCLQKRFDAMDAHLNAAEIGARRLAQTDACWKREAKIVRGKTAAIRAQASLYQKNYAQTLVWSERALASLPQHIRNERSAVLLNRAQAFEHLGKFEDAHRAFAEAVRGSRAADHPFIHLGALYAHARFLWRQGNTSEAERLLKRALAFAREKNVVELAEPAQILLDEISKERNAPHAHDALSPREREILQWLARGETNSQIAKRLTIGVGTVNWHTKNIYKKLGARNRTQAAAMTRGEPANGL